MKFRSVAVQKVRPNNAPSSVQVFEEGAIKVLKDGGFRITMQTVQVIRVLGWTTTALSAYQIHEKIVAADGMIEVVSVDRILAKLQEVGLVYHIGVVGAYFPCRLANATQRSLLIVDEAAKDVVEVALPSQMIEAIQQLGTENGFDVSTIKIEVVGTMRR